MITLAVAGLMWRRFRTERAGLWSLLFLAGTAVAGADSAFLPWLSAFLASGMPIALVLGWQTSGERRGLMQLCERHPGAVNRLSTAEVLAPACCGIVPGALAAVASGTVPWQIWLVLPLAAVLAAASALLLEKALPKGGIVLLGLYWMWSFIRLKAAPDLSALVFFPAYPAHVIAGRTGAPHNDGFVAVSAVLACVVLYFFFRRNRTASS
ncbi:MAG: hypothetical protein R6V62_06705 [Candidatus Fermentibacteraceae bacterium]